MTVGAQSVLLPCLWLHCSLGGFLLTQSLRDRGWCQGGGVVVPPFEPGGHGLWGLAPPGAGFGSRWGGGISLSGVTAVSPEGGGTAPSPVLAAILVLPWLRAL